MNYKINQGLRVRNRDWSIIVLMYALLAMTFVALNMAYCAWMQQGMTMRTVKAVCDYAHNINDGTSEEACGLAQDAGEIQYICVPAEFGTKDCHTEAVHDSTDNRFRR